MKVEQILHIWKQSKYEQIGITGLPCVRHDKEVVCPMAIYKKDQIILNGGEYKVIDYLKHIYKENVFIYEDANSTETIWFKIIM